MFVVRHLLHRFRLGVKYGRKLERELIYQIVGVCTPTVPLSCRLTAVLEWKELQVIQQITIPLTTAINLLVFYFAIRHESYGII